MTEYKFEEGSVLTKEGIDAIAQVQHRNNELETVRQENRRLHEKVEMLVGFLLKGRVCPKCGSGGMICDEMSEVNPRTNRYTCLHPRCEEVIYGD